MAKTKTKLSKNKSKTAAEAKPAAKKPAAKKVTAKAASKTVAKKTAAKGNPKAALKASPKSKAITPAKNSPSRSGAKSATTEAKTSAPKKTAARKTNDNLDGLFTPLDDRVLIERTAAADRTPGGLYIPESAAERPNEGCVVAVGRGHRDKKGRLRPLDVQMGDMVMFAGFTGSEVKIGEQEVFVVREKDIIAVVKI